MGPDRGGVVHAGSDSIGVDRLRAGVAAIFQTRKNGGLDFDRFADFTPAGEIPGVGKP